MARHIQTTAVGAEIFARLDIENVSIELVQQPVAEQFRSVGQAKDVIKTHLHIGEEFFGIQIPRDQDDRGKANAQVGMRADLMKQSLLALITDAEMYEKEQDIGKSAKAGKLLIMGHAP